MTRSPKPLRSAFIAAVAAALLSTVAPSAHGAQAAATADLVQIKPSAADPRVVRFDDPDVVLVPQDSTASTPLVVFLPGTGGKPAMSIPFLRVIAAQGYRVISLDYDDEPAVQQVCPRDPDPACAADFRRMRVEGAGPSRTVSNPPEEGVEQRLVALIRTLDRSRPGEGWGDYLDGDHPAWWRMVLSGLSQGAGMAAFIAKAHETERVVLFSSPWDFTGPGRMPAPWLSAPSATPPERWWAEYNARELTAAAIQRAYAALRIPPDHQRVFDRDLPAGCAARSPNPYHGITIRDPAYTEDWRWLFSRPAG